MNMFCKTQKANSREFSANYDLIFSSGRDIMFPEEKRELETERLLKNAESEKENDAKECHQELDQKG